LRLVVELEMVGADGKFTQTSEQLKCFCERADRKKINLPNRGDLKKLWTRALDADGGKKRIDNCIRAAVNRARKPLSLAVGKLREALKNR
jgi:hypothetical protein